METIYPGKGLLTGRAEPAKAILFGNRIAPYHPLGGVEPVLYDLFSAEFDLQVVDGFRAGVLQENSPRLVIGYEDTWETILSDESAEEIARFVETGGGLLLLHNGICWANHPRIRMLAGAQFVGHPEQEVLTYEPCGSHPAVRHVGPFTLREEPYRYQFEESFAEGVFLRYRDSVGQWAAGWSQTAGAGRIICLQPGHLPEVFLDAIYRRLLLQSAQWCAGFAVSAG